MSSTALIIAAVLIPVVLILALLAFTKGTIAMTRRPRVWAVVMMIWGPIYAAAGVWDSPGRVGTLAFVIGGVLFFIGGVYQWFRGVPVDLD